ncbi:hypothetical protein POM88_028839 [Heracleum sosnowskyi]|uniref:Uncharacterized protein n=1 Tax=Heracleum sosnowskyi TaxID=360622 RepID=A0AAD8MGQ2_9APIA|nr:hypothetical protein POM88_028839 [Heracleum sosnowskyi]
MLHYSPNRSDTASRRGIGREGLDRDLELSLDLETIKALSAVSSFLNRSPSPFCKLKYVKVPEGYKESSISAYLICYLLGRSPKATIVTTFPRGNFTPQRWPVCLSSQNLLPEKLLETPIAGAYNDRAISCSFRPLLHELHLSDSPVDNAKCKLRDLKTLGMEKIAVQIRLFIS